MKLPWNDATSISREQEKLDMLHIGNMQRYIWILGPHLILVTKSEKILKTQKNTPEK